MVSERRWLGLICYALALIVSIVSPAMQAQTNPPPAHLQLALAPSELSENAGSVQFTITRLGEVEQAVELIYVTGDSPESASGIAGVDFGLQAGLLKFNVGETTAIFTLPIYDNSLAQGDRSFLVRLYKDSLPLVTFNVVIHDNEIPSQIDSGFNPSLRPRFAGDVVSVATIAFQPDGGCLVGGNFVSPVGTNLARLNPDGSLDQTFRVETGATNTWLATQGIWESVRALALQPDGKIIVGGDFAMVNGKERSGLARLNRDGTLDKRFNARVSLNRPATESARAWVQAIVILPDESILVGGRFDAVNGVARTNLARLRTDGSLETGFGLKTGPLGPDDEVKVLVLDSKQQILVGGRWSEAYEIWNGAVCRLNFDGSRDTGFSLGGELTLIGGEPYVSSIQIRADGNILIAGRFHQFGELEQSGAALLTSSGALASSLGAEMGISTWEVLATADRSDPLSSIYLARTATLFGVIYYTSVSCWSFDGRRDMRFPAVRASGIPQALVMDPSGDYLLLGTYGGLVRIYTNPQRPVVRFALNAVPNVDSAVGERDGEVIVAVERTGASNAELSVDYFTRDDTARAGVNYTPMAGSLRFAPSEIRKTIAIPILPDGHVTGNLGFEVRLGSPPIGTAFESRTLQISIVDRDFGFPMELIRRLPDGRLQFQATNANWATVIEGSQDLILWNKVADGATIRVSTNSPQRFFRARRIGP